MKGNDLSYNTYTIRDADGWLVGGFVGGPVRARAGHVLRQWPRVDQALPDEDQALSDSVGYFGYLEVAQQVGLPILAGTDTELDNPPELTDPLNSPLESDLTLKPVGFALQAELAMYVAEGLTPLAALQSATLNPAKLLHGTDSLGTVAAGKLADLVLLDANPLADITNTTAIRAVVANGRYFDRAALDQLLIDVPKQVKQGYRYWVTNIGSYDDDRASKPVDGTWP